MRGKGRNTSTNSRNRKIAWKKLYFSEVERRQPTQLSHALVLWDSLGSGMSQWVKWLSACPTAVIIPAVIGPSCFVTTTNKPLGSSEPLFHRDSVGFILGRKAVRPLISIRYLSLVICGVLLPFFLLGGTLFHFVGWSEIMSTRYVGHL
jgi:hypothetical protein